MNISHLYVLVLVQRVYKFEVMKTQYHNNAYVLCMPYSLSLESSAIIDFIYRLIKRTRSLGDSSRIISNGWVVNFTGEKYVLSSLFVLYSERDG